MRSFLKRLGLYRLDQRLKGALGITKSRMSHPPFSSETQSQIKKTIDAVRYSSIALACKRIEADDIPGDLVEVGVFQGKTARFLRQMMPDRRIHLFDTFQGFCTEDFEKGENTEDFRFLDTDPSEIEKQLCLGGSGEVVMHVGHFPGTAEELTEERFAFLSLDVDKYIPTLAGLEVFYPKMSPGGFIFIHDFHNPESNFGVSKAVNEWCEKNQVLYFELPDANGTVIIRRPLS